MLALTVPELLDAAVAVGTGALALATFVMAKAARDEAKETRRLAEIAERSLEVETRHVEATTLPVLRIYRAGWGDEGLVWIDDDELRVTVENRGAASATVEQSVVNLPGGGGAQGTPEGGDTVPADDGQLTIDFPIAPEQIARALSGAEVNIQVVYSASGAERRKALLAVVKPKGNGDRWLVLRERIKDV